MIGFKTPRQEADFNELKNKNLRLYEFVILLTKFVNLELKKEVVLTDVFRSKEEFDALYAATPPEKRPASSPHCLWNAVDIRSSIYTPAEITRIVSFANQFKYKDGSKPVALYHTISGNVAHMHFQYF